MQENISGIQEDQKTDNLQENENLIPEDQKTNNIQEDIKVEVRIKNINKKQCKVCGREGWVKDSSFDDGDKKDRLTFKFEHGTEYSACCLECYGK